MRIAVVDPSRTALKAVSQLLESDGHVISVFVDGHDALDFIKTNSDVNALITSADLDTLLDAPSAANGILAQRG